MSEEGHGIKLYSCHFHVVLRHNGVDTLRLLEHVDGVRELTEADTEVTLSCFSSCSVGPACLMTLGMLLLPRFNAVCHNDYII